MDKSRTSSSLLADDSQKNDPHAEQSHNSLNDADSITKEKSPESPAEASKLVRKPTYKEQKRIYKEEKKRLTDEILTCLSESTFLIESGWLKARTTIKTWTKLWCELKPAGLILYRTEKTNETNAWTGTVLLPVCRVIERPSKKDGFCFKIYHPLDQSIWANKGPHGEILKFGIPFPTEHIILRAPNDIKGEEWLSSIKLVIKHSPDYFTQQPSQSGSAVRESLRRTVSVGPDGEGMERTGGSPTENRQRISNSEDPHPDGTTADETDSQEEDEDDDYQDAIRDAGQLSVDASGSSHHSQTAEPVAETAYVLNQEEELGNVGELETKLPEDERSLFWHLLLQVRPGMDLSKVVLPTFILDPRSFLDKLSDYYYHADLIERASLSDSPLERMKGIIVWYFSGFYKKPKGVKKPYNPILGEVFRCCWDQPGTTSSRTFYIAEQVSHHPPVTAFHVSNRKAGFLVSGAVLAKSKFKGNSIQAILEGHARVRLLRRGEEYIVTMPHVNCKGMIYGKLAMDLGGKVSIECPTTGYSTEINFSVWLTRTTNPVEGKIKLGQETMATLSGSWDGEIFWKDMKTRVEESIWKPVPDKRLRRLTVEFDKQRDYESEKLWCKVTQALLVGNQETATKEKNFLEDRQRQEARERALLHSNWTPRFFSQDDNGDWAYKYTDGRPWDPLLDLQQYEHDFIIGTKMLHDVGTSDSKPFEFVMGSESPRQISMRHASVNGQNNSRRKSMALGHSSPSRTADESARERFLDSSVLSRIQSVNESQKVILKELESLGVAFQKEQVFQRNRLQRIEYRYAQILLTSMCAVIFYAYLFCK